MSGRFAPEQSSPCLSIESSHGATVLPVRGTPGREGPGWRVIPALPQFTHAAALMAAIGPSLARDVAPFRVGPAPCTYRAIRLDVHERTSDLSALPVPELPKVLHRSWSLTGAEGCWLGRRLAYERGAGRLPNRARSNTCRWLKTARRIVGQTCSRVTVGLGRTMSVAEDFHAQLRAFVAREVSLDDLFSTQHNRWGPPLIHQEVEVQGYIPRERAFTSDSTPSAGECQRASGASGSGSRSAPGSS